MHIQAVFGLIFIILIFYLLISWMLKSIKKGIEEREEYRKNVTDKCPNCGKIDALRDINKELLRAEKSWRKKYDYKERKQITVAGYNKYYKITRQCRYCGHLVSEETGYFYEEK